MPQFINTRFIKCETIVRGKKNTIIHQKSDCVKIVECFIQCSPMTHYNDYAIISMFIAVLVKIRISHKGEQNSVLLTSTVKGLVCFVLNILY